ncbi:DUF1045 domain-containing protein [Oceanicola sp. 502str15]|uniref:DUF1045 domain-containing protein n=1 Tax=Oceanicola sp. 502str15 TaxID=2696061 RepID=UPI002094A74F|nr:DUF1045 domain-containing protein [Oceanicola sp. 502str15]MCO6384333.1 DUF1045 domain-containing protein [Oceanicola sp. 502str15]
MEEFRRYAIYYAPPEGPLADFGAAWLGWDAAGGQEVAQPEVPGLDMAAIAEAPRKYGFHGTIKPPFRLSAGHDRAGLEAALEDLARGLEPVEMAGLRLARIGRFMALVPVGDSAALEHLAARVVEGLDGFRAVPEAAELARRRAAGLTERQDALLLRWGYPYVMEEFRFHLTLTGRLEGAEADRVEAALAERLEGLLPAPFRIGSLCLFGEGNDGRFRLLRREPLGGGAAG